MSQPLLSQAQQWIENNPQLLTPLLPITATTTTTSLNQTPLHLIYSIFHNILIDPKNEKFRHLKMENKKLKEFILEIDGAIDLLYLFGFEMIGGNDLFLDFNQINLNEIKSFVNYLEKQYFTINNNNQPINQPINTTPTNQKQSSFIQQPLQQTQSTNYNNTTNNTTTNNTTTNVIKKTKEELEKERILEERKRQLAEEKRLKREEMNRIKKQSKLDRKEKQKDDEEEQLHPHHQEHHSSSYGTDKRHSGTNYSGMTTYKDLGVNM
ncbi:hypothetical protein ABK040_006211 [Willaertia magna]